MKVRYFFYFALPFMCGPIHAQTTATWTGGGDGANYNDPLNWDGGIVPINGNGSGTDFRVIIPNSTAVTYNVPGTSNEVFQLILGNGSTLNVNPGRSLSVQDEAASDGSIVASGGSLLAPSPATQFSGGQGVLQATGGGTIVYGAPTYVNNQLANGDFFRTSGSGSTLDLSSLIVLTYGVSGAKYTKSITAAGGRIDLSGLTDLDVTQGEDDILEISVENGSEIDLSNLRRLNQNASGAEIRTRLIVDQGASLPLGDQAGGGADLTAKYVSFQADAGGMINAPNLTGAETSLFTGGSTSWRTGDVGLPLPAGSVINAPRLSNVKWSTIHVSDNSTLITAPLTEIDQSRIWVSGGSNFDRVVDTDYVTDTFMYDTDLFNASDEGTVLDLSSLQSLTFGYSGYQSTYRIRATDSGRIDLSGLTHLGVEAGEDDRLDFYVGNGGSIDLSGLRSINTTFGNDNERVRFHVSGSSVLELGDQSTDGQDLSVVRTEFLPGVNATINAPNLSAAQVSQFTGGGTTYRTGDAGQPLPSGSVINAPRLSNVKWSTIHISDSSTLVTAPLTEIDQSRIWVSGGAAFDRVADTDYVTDTHMYDTDLFQARDPGTLLDLSSLQSLTFGYGGYQSTYRIRATDSGRIDLSGLTNLNVEPGEDDQFEIIVGNGGSIDLSGLQSINTTGGNGNERVRIYVSGDSMLELGDQSIDGQDLSVVRTQFLHSADSTINAPNLTAAQVSQFTGGGTTYRTGDAGQPLPAGSVINAPRLSNVKWSTIHVSDNSTLITAPLTEIDQSRIWVSGGATFDRVADTDYVTDTHMYDTDLFQARDPGTLLDLSSLQSLTFGYGGYQSTYRIRATDSGRIDLSGLTNLNVEPGEDDQFEIIVGNGGSIDLSGLQSINTTGGNGNERVRIYVSGDSMLELGDQSIDGQDLSVVRTQFLHSADSTINAPNLTAAQVSQFTGGGTTYRTGDAGQPLPAGSVINAPRLSNVKWSTIHVSDNSTLITAPLTEIDQSRIWVSGGAAFDRVADTDYVTDTHMYDTDLFQARDPGTLLDLSSLQSLTFGYGGYQSTYRIRATDSGRIDLSGLTNLNVEPGEDDQFEIIVGNGGSIDLSGLQSINTTGGNGNERVRIYVSGDSMLELGDQSIDGQDLSVVRTQFLHSADSTINAPNLTAAQVSQFTGGGTTYRTGDAGQPLPAGSVINAPRLSNVKWSTIHVSDNSTLITAPLTEIDQSRIWVSGGATFDRVADTDYVTDTHMYDTDLFQARDPGTLLDLSSLQSLTFGYNNYQSTYRIRATDSGRIDLSGLTELSVKSGEDDRLEFHITSGEIDLSSLGSINSTVGNGNERVRFFIEEQGTLQLGNLAVANRAEFFMQHISSEVDVAGSLFLESTSTFEMVEGAQINIGGDLLYRQTNTALAQFDQGIVNLDGTGIQFIEAGSSDDGITGTGADNFGIGQLEIGQDGVPTTAHILDLFDNGNRGDGPFEALYLNGLGGDPGLVIHTGSMLVLNDVNVYAWLDGEMRHLNALFDSDVNDSDLMAIPFGAGFLALEAPQAGDFDFDGDVDGGDFLVWQRNHGSTNNLAPDANRDGLVDAADLAIWQDAWGRVANAASRAVPEPGSLINLMLAVQLTFAARHRRLGAS